MGHIYRVYVRRRPTIKWSWYVAQPAGCTDATRSWTRPRLRSHLWHPGWAVTRLTVTASSLAAATFQLPHFFPRVICNWDYWKHPLALFFICTAAFLSYFHSYRTQCVKAFSRDGKHGAGHFDRWNVSRMRISTSRCYSRPISASAQLEVPPSSGDVSRVPACRVKTMISGVTMIINSPNWPEIHWIRGILQQGMVVARQATATYIEIVVQWRHIIFTWYGTRTGFFTCQKTEPKTDSKHRCTRLTAYRCTRLIIIILVLDASRWIAALSAFIYYPVDKHKRMVCRHVHPMKKLSILRKCFRILQ